MSKVDGVENGTRVLQAGLEAWGSADDQLRQPSLMLVDDDPFSLGLHQQILRGMGYVSIATASGGQEALLVLASEPRAVDVVVCDLNMPGMDGIEFLQALDSSGFNGGVILLSGEGVRIMHTVQKLLRSGRLTVLGALTKPAPREPLGVLLRQWRKEGPSVAHQPALMCEPAELFDANRLRQWVLHYQPQVDMRTGAFIGVEALVRWNHPARGLLYPDDFIDQAEECGAIDGLTDCVLAEAMEQLARWRTETLMCRIAINVSMENLLQPAFARVVTDMARSHALPTRSITLEITESRLISHLPAPLENLVRLRMQRFELSIDDFGTGHSSLAQLRDVPFSELKVDRGFVQNARHNPIIRPILEASISVAKRLGMESLAEGIETEDDWRLLSELGCGLAQGYFIAKPMPAEQLPGWIREWDQLRAQLPAWLGEWNGRGARFV